MRALLPTPARPALFSRLILCGFAVALLLLAVVAPQARADVQDFMYNSWSVDYEIGVDSEGRAEARVTETMTAVFPEHDQNRGIVRGIPDRYEGASTQPRDFTVTDESGESVPFEIESDDGITAVLTGDNSFVHGAHTYVISYTLSDVVLARDDGSADEFYWDVMDFEHAQPVAHFTATFRFDEVLGGEINGDAACYVGAAEAVTECTIKQATATTDWRLSAGPLAPGEGVTVALGLNPGSVVQPSTRLPSFTFDVLPPIVSVLALAVGVLAYAISVRLRRRRRTARGTIIAQYDVPAALPPLLAASIVGASPHPVPAELVHLAVAGAIRIEAGTPRPTLHLADPARAIDPLDQRTLNSVFGTLTPGTSFTLPSSSEKFAHSMTKLRKLGHTEADKRGYFERVHSPVGRVIGVTGIVLASAAMVFAAVALVVRESPLPLLAFLGAGVALGFSVVGTVSKRVHTPAGAEAREHLMGVHEFIRVAEADRLEVLQSYQGAQRQQTDGIEIVQIYERLLPYAMIFGLQKQWTNALEVRYENAHSYAPVWFMGAGLGVMSLTELGSSISQFTSATMSSVSYSSSSSGGSTGGGFAGGGGGGGFSGGR